MARRETLWERHLREERIEEEAEQHNIRVINNFQASLDTSSGSSVDLRVIPVNERVASEEEKSTDSWRIDQRALFYRDTAAILNIDVPSSIQATEAYASSLGSPSIVEQSGEERRVVIEIRVEAPGSVAPKGVTVRVVHSDLQRVRVYCEEDSCDQVTEQDTTEEEVVRICAKREEAWKFEIEILNTDPARKQEAGEAQQEGSNKRQRLDR